jgi:uncharacterized protein YggT (Ycf19 family)
MTIPIGARSFTVRFARIFGYFVYFWLLASLVILTLGFFLKLFAANPDAGFVEWVYRNLDRTMEPFRGMFPQQAVGDTGSILDVSILFAMLMYVLVAMGIRALINWLTFRMNRIDREMAAAERQQTAAMAAAVDGSTIPGAASATPEPAVPPPAEPATAAPQEPAGPFDRTSDGAADGGSAGEPR